MLAHICNLNTELAATLVNVQFSGFKDGATVTCIEVFENHIVVEESIEVPVKVHELVDAGYLLGIASH